jgi:hypothetical protein
MNTTHEGRLDRTHLLNENRDKILKAVAESDVADPVALVLDTNDPIAFALARAMDPKGAATHREDCRKQGLIPTQIAVCDRATAAATVGKSTPNGSKVLSLPPLPGNVWVVCVSGGANAYVQIEKPNTLTSWLD